MDKRPHAERDAEAGFERLLRETLRDDAGTAGSECVEPDMLAAWSEGVLSPSERSFVEAHAARCPRCQGMLAAMARTVPVEAAPAAWSMRRWVMMLAPAAAAATAIALWFAVEPRRSQLEQSAPQVAAVRDAASQPSASAPVSEEARTSGARLDAPAAAPTSQAAPAPKSTAAPSERERRAIPLADARKDVDQRIDPEAGRRQEIDRLTAEAKKDLAAATARARGYAGGTVNTNTAVNAEVNAAASAANAKSANAVPAPAPPAAPKPTDVVTTVTAQSPAVQTAQTSVQQQAAAPDQPQRQGDRFRVAGAGAGRSGGQALERAALNEIVVVPPVAIALADEAVRWRVLSERVIQQSSDSGATWATQYALDEKSTLTAGSSPTPLVAWFVGENGLVVLTTDGRTWRRIPFPEAVNLVSVLAIDARTATVATSDRRSFTTTNGGASWTVVKD
jgi:hypothetical protein